VFCKLFRVRAAQRLKANNVKRLQSMSTVRWKYCNIDFRLQAIVQKVLCEVAAMAVEDE
jgi:hypothetical protein